MGGTTAFSSEDNVVSLVVTSVNDAPALADTALAMTETEDAGVPGVGAGTLISDLVGGISDVDSGAQQGLAIIGANAAQGTWHFSIDAGTNWQQLGAPLPGDAVLLAADALTRIYFEPNANYNGVQAAALTVRAWDQTSGSNGATSGIDTTVNGTTTAFSTATDTVSLTVLALNDAPTISNNTLVIDTGGASENTKIALGSIFTLGEIDLARFEGSNLGQLTLSVPHGAFVLDTTGVSVTAGSQASDRGAGDWGGGTGTLTFTGTLAQLQSALNTVEYVPGDNPDSSETITVTFNDLNNAGAGAASGGSDVHSASASVDILNIAPVNDAPTISRPATVSATEDVQFNFNGGNTISIADVDARNGIVQVALSIPTGTITLTQGATAVTGGSLGSSTFTLQGTVSEINGALATLKYTSALDDNSLNVNDADRTLAIAVSDLGNSLGGNPLTTTTHGTANASTLINLAAVNDTPTLDVDPAGGVQATRATTTVGENATTAISDIILADSSDISDSGYGSNTNIAVTALHGTLTLDASTGVVAVPSGSPSGRSLTLTGSIADINAAIVASHLKYTPDSNFSGNDNLHLVFHDAGNSGSGGDMSALADIPLLVSGVNDAPGFVGLGGGSVGFTEDGAPVVLDVDATLTDPELVGYDNWGGAILTVQRTAAVGNPGSAVTDDVFGVTGSGSVGVNFIGNNVRIGTNIVGSVDTSTGGVLTIEFDDTTTTAQANLVLQALTYSNSNDNPPTQVTIGYTINDGNDNTGLTAQGSGNPLALEGSGSVVVDIAATNDAPVLTLGAGPMDQFFEDGAASQLAPNAVLSDPELSFLASGNGDWGSAILSLQGSSGPDPEDVFGVTGNGAIGVNFNGSDLRIGTRVVGTFSNAGGAFSVIFTAGTATAEVEQVTQALTYRNTRQSLADGQVDILNQLLWTINDGNTGDNVTAGPQGLGGAEEAAVTQDITLRGANDAPVLADTVLAITVPEDNALPMAAVGTVLSALIGGASDVDASAVYGVAIIDSDTTMGTWFYSINGGSTWLDVGVVAENSALLLRDSDRLYFQPNLDSNGTLAPAPGLFGLKLRAWDQTGSTASAAGTKVNVSSIGIGDTTPFSTATDTVALTVIAINDAPTRLLASVDLADSLEDAASPSQETIANLFDGAGSHAAFSDTKDDQTAFTGGSVANLFVGIVITDNAATAAQGTWQYSADGIGAWSNISTALTSASGLFLPGTYTLRFQAAADWNGTPGSLSVRLADNSVGVLPAAEDSVDVSNDTTLSGAGTRYSNSSNAVSLGTSITSVNDAPAGADKTITAIEDIAYQFQAADFGFTDVHDNPANNLASVLISALPVTGTLKLSGTALTVPQSISVADIANLTWAPPPDLNGSAVASFTFQVGDDGGVLNGGIDTDTSANTITFDVSAVVDIVGDSQTTAEETAVTTNLLSNDNFEGSPLVTGVTQGAHGTVVNNNDGTVTYTPDADYNGSDSYTYTVTSPVGVSETATVTVTINPVVDIADDVAVTDEDTAVTTDVLANDNFEGSPLVTGVTQGAHGTVVNNNDGTVTYTPDADYNGSDSYTYTVTSPTGVTETATVNVTINPVVDIADDVAVTDEDTAVTTDVLANDNFAGSPLVTGVTQGAHGTVVNNNDGTVTYTPDADYNGSDSYTYTVTSPVGITETATVTVTINPVVDIVDDTEITDEGSAVTTDVLANDNFEGSPLVTGVTQGAHGTVVNNNDGTVTYTPDADYNGSDSYTYTVTSPAGVAETATVNVTINPVADIVDDIQTTDEDTAVTTDVLANDNFEGSPVVSAVTQGAHGTVVNNNDGTVTYTPDADYNGSDSYTYTVTSPAGVTETATVTVTINPIVDIADDVAVTDEDTAVTTDVLANDNFEGSPLVTGVTQGAHGTVVNNNDGTVTYTPDADYNGSDSYTYTVTSPAGVTETATVNVRINPIVDIADDTQTTDEDTAVTTDVLANDNFEGSPLVTGVTQGTHGTVVNNNDGTVTYTPDADYNGSDSYTYTVTSPVGITETATVTVTINPVVDIVDDTEITDEGSAVTTDVLANDNFEGSPLVTGVTQGAHGTVVNNNDGTVTYTPDADYNGSDSYTYTVTSPAGVTETATVNVTINPVVDIADDVAVTDEDTAVTTNVLANDNFEGSPLVTGVTQGAHGTVVNNNDGTVTYTPVADYNGSDSYTYTVTSPTGVTETATVMVTINPVVDIVDDTEITDEGSAVTTDVLANDNFEGSPLVTGVTQGAHGTVVNNNDGTVTYTPDADYNGSDSYTYTVTSPTGVTETATVNVTINPVVDVVDDVAVTDEDSAVTTDVLANDNFEGSPLVTGVTQGAHGTVVNNNDGTVTYTPDADYNGSDSYTYTVTSPAGVTETATVNVTINPIVDIADDVAVTDEEAAVTTDVLANDTFEGSPLVTGVTQGAHGTVVNNNDGTVTYTPDADYNGSDSYTYTVTSPVGVTETATVTVTINPIVDIVDDVVVTDEDTAVTTDVLANDNFEGSPLVTGVTQGAHGTVVNNNDGTVTYTPDADYNGSDSYTYTVTSPTGVTETATVTVTINSVVDIADDNETTDEGAAVTTDVLANDNFEGSPLVTGVTQGAHGTVVNNNDGTVTYTPDADYNGSDSYTYTVTSPTGVTETATVIVTINPIVDIADDVAVTDEDAAVTTDVLANDNFEGSPLVTGVTQGAHGTVVNNNDGTVTYTPDADYNGSDSYTYTVTSPTGVTETATVIVTINPIVDIADDTQTTDEDSAVTTDVVANDNFEGSPLVTGVTQGAHGTVVNNNDGTVTYTPDADYNGSDSYTYTVTSPTGVTETATVIVTINPIVDIADDTQTTDEDSAVTTDVVANDNFEGSPLVTGVTQGAHGTVVNNNDGTVTYTPDADYNGSDSYTYTVTSPTGVTETATVIVTINPIVDIADDTQTTDEDTAVTTDVVANDNFEGSPLVTGVTQGAHGTVVNNNDGTVTYTPDADYNGSDSYTYTVTSPTGVTETATVIVTINPIVDIADDTQTTDEDSAVTTDVVANDNFEGSPLVTGVTQGAHGTVVINNDGTVTYTPDADYNGSDSYTYTVTSPAGVTETATVNVTINPVADIADDTQTTDEDTAVTTDVLANDNFEGSPVVSAVTQGAHGTVVNNNDGTVTYTPDADYNGSDSYTYTVTSPVGITETATVNVTINPVADIADDTQTTDEDSAVTTDVVANDNFEGSPLVTGVTQGAHGTVVINNDGTVTYTPDADYNGSDSYTYTVTSPAGVTETATVNVTINPVADIADDTQTTDEDTAVTTDVLANDNFEGSPVVSAVTQGAHGTVVNNNDGTVTYTPDADYNGSDSYTYTVTSPAGVTETATVNVTINPVADIADDTQTTDEDTAVTTDVLANDNFEGSPVVSAVTQGAHGTVVNNNDGTVTYTPDADYNGSDSYTYTVTSPTGVTETATVTVTINSVADIADDNETTDEDTAVTTDVLANDNFAGSPLVTGVTQGAHGTVVNNNDGTVTYTPDADYNGSDSYTYTVTSPVGITETATVNVTINPVADIADDTQTTDEDSAVTTNVLANDNFEGSPVVSAVTQGAHGTVVNNNDGTVTYTPDADYNGSDSYTYTVTSPTGVTETATVTVTINSVADIADDNETTDEDTAVTTDVLANDNFEGSPLVTGVTQGAHGTVVNNNDGTVTYTPDADYNGSDSYTYTVTSPTGVTETATVTVTINSVVDIADDNETTDEDTAVTTDVLANDNFEGSPLVTGVTQGAHGTVVNNNDGTVTYTPDADYNGSDSYTYTVTSPAGVTETATVTVTINPVVDVVDDVAVTDEDSAVTTDVLANDNFEGSPLVTGVTQGAHGTVVNNNDGTVTYTPNADYNGSDSYTYTVTSPAGVAETATVNVTINPIVDIVDDVVVTDEDTAVTTNVLANDNFAGSPLVTGVTQGAHGTVVNNNDGTVTYIPDADYNGSDSYTYTVTSPVGITETATVNVTINPVADIADDTQTTDEDSAVTTNVLANDNFEGSPVVSAVTQGAHGTVVNNNDGTVTYTPDADYNGSDSYTYTVTSPTGVTETATVTVTINPIVDIADDIQTTDEDTAVTTDVLANDNFEGSPLVTGVTQGAHGTVVNNNDGTVTYTPDADYNGSDSYTYTVTSPTVVTETATVNVTINPVADIADDVAVTDEEMAVTTNVLANDNFEGSPLVTGVTQGAHGTVVNNNDGSVTYTPAADYNGSDSYTYTVTSPTGVTETATVTVTINSVVDIADDNETTDEDTAVTTDVLANDNFEGSPLVTGVTQGAHGTVVSNNDGTVTYTPDADYNGSDSYTYTVTSPTGVTETATVNVTINPVTDIVADRLTTSSTAALRFDPLAGTNGASADNFENSAAVISAIGTPSHGRAVLNPDGTITYTPIPGYVGADSFSYTVSSGGVSEMATITVAVTNATPLAAPDIASTPEDTLLTGNVLSNDSDPDAGDSLTVTQFVVDGVTVDVPAGTVGGSTLIAGVGTLTVKADGSYSFSPLTNWNGNVPTVSYSIRDSAGATASSTLSITVGGGNDPPTANDDNYDTTDTAGPPGGTPISGNVLGNDSDPDAGTTLEVVAIDGGAGSVGGNTAGSFGSLTLNADGRFTYAVDQGNATVVSLQRGDSLTETFSYTISDGDGATSSATIIFTIHGTNDAPSAGNDRNSITEEQVSASGNVISGAKISGGGVSSTDPAARDIDPNGDPLTVTEIRLADNSAGVVGASFAGQFGALTIDAAGDYVYALDNANVAVQALHDGETLSDSFVYTTSDGRGSFVDATLTMTISGSNDAPLAVADVNRISEDSPTPISGNVLLNDSDVDSNSTLSVVAVSGASPGAVDGHASGSFGTLTLNADGSYSYALDNSHSAVQALAVEQTLSDVFTYTVSDGEGGSTSTTLTIIIDGENDAPLANADTASAAEDTLLTGNVLSNDSDPDRGDRLTVTQFVVDGVTVVVPAGAVGGSTTIAGVGTLTLTADGDYRFTPLPDWNGRVPTVSYTVRDSAGATAISSLEITVIPALESRVSPYVFENFDVARWLDAARMERIFAPIEQPFFPAQYVLQQVGRAQESLAEAVAALLGVYDARQAGELRSLLRDFYQTMTPGQFVLDQGVAFSRELLAELQQRALLSSHMAVGGESLYDDFSIFSPLQIVANPGQLPTAGGIPSATAEEPAALPEGADAGKAAAALEPVAGTESADGFPRGAGSPGVAADGLLPPVLPAARSTPAAVARSFSEQLRQSQSERRRVPLI
jgi:VCBS repeat-containing protein